MRQVKRVHLQIGRFSNDNSNIYISNLYSTKMTPFFQHNTKLVLSPLITSPPVPLLLFFIKDMRGRSYHYSPSPERGFGRRYRSPSPRRRHYRAKEPVGPTSLLVRNLRLDCRPEDLREPFGRFGPIKDIYLPRDYYTGEPRGFGFVQFVDPADAADAKNDMDGYVLFGRELTVVFAEEIRKKPFEMRARERTRNRSYTRRRSSASYSRSPGYARTYSRSPYDYSPRRSYSRSISPGDRSYRGRSYRDHSYSRSQSRSSYGSRSCSYSRSVTPGYSR